MTGGTAAESHAGPFLGRLEREGIAHLWVVYTDYNGRSQAKSVPRGRFESIVSRGVTFARANLDFNVLDHMVSEARFTADTGDFFAVPDPQAYAQMPHHPATGRAMAWMREEDGSAWDGCPRTTLARQVDAYAAAGMRVEAAFEPEAYLFAEDAPGHYVPADHTRMFTAAGLDTHAALLQRLSETLEAMGVVVEQVAPEYGPGQIEINISHAPPLKAADDLVTLKDMLRALAREAGLTASFMPKPYEEIAGCGLHVHLSLWDVTGERSLMEDERGSFGLSATGRAFIGGILRHAAALTGLGAPTVNSYKRLQPGSWAPAHAAYGIGNRAALVRVPGGARRRVEVRAGDNTSSPYLYLTGLLAAGLEGIQSGADPGPPAVGDLGRLSSAEARDRGVALLPRSATDALDVVEADPLMAEALGPTILPEWLKVKRSEIAAYDLAVGEWERTAYLQG